MCLYVYLDWKSCTKQMQCSETCVKAYMKRYGSRCTGTPNPTCRDYARIHNGGPSGCKTSSKPETEKNLQVYWAKVKKCCDRKGGC